MGYFYYFLREINIEVPNSIAMCITFLQIFQMFFGIFINGCWVYFKYIAEFPCLCSMPKVIVLSCAVMYGSYLYLFLSFFVKRYLKTPPKNNDDKKNNKNNKNDSKKTPKSKSD